MEKGNVQGLERADIEQPITAATQQVRQMDVEQTPSFYKGQLGDSYMPFKQYFTESKKSKSKKRKKKKFAGIKKPSDNFTGNRIGGYWGVGFGYGFGGYGGEGGGGEGVGGGAE
jgi:hypothetical protein